MTGPEEKLTSISAELRRGVTPAAVSVRDLLDWFGVARRRSNVVRQIRSVLERTGLDTVPDFESAYVDGPIKFVLAGSSGGQDLSSTAHRIGSLESANRRPVSVDPSGTLAEATTIMLANDYSQLPVMTSEREVKGAISWKSIGCRLALGGNCTLVRECMDPANVVDADASLFDAIALVAQNDYVLVRAQDKVISGIVTSSDLSQQFRDLAEPFLLIGEIENHVRRLIHGKFNAEELQEAKDPGDTDRRVEGVVDLTFGEYIRLIEEPGRWERLGARVDRREFITCLNEVREVRNDVMHFDPQGIEPDSLQALRRFVRLLQEMRRYGAF